MRKQHLWVREWAKNQRSIGMKTKDENIFNFSTVRDMGWPLIERLEERQKTLRERLILAQVGSR